MNFQDLLHPNAAVEATLNMIFLWFTVVALLGGLVFVLSYSTFFNWRKNPSGRATFYLAVALTAVLGIIVLARFLGDYPGRALLTLVIYTSLPLTLIGLNVALWRAYGKKPVSGQHRDAATTSYDRTEPKRR